MWGCDAEASCCWAVGAVAEACVGDVVAGPFWSVAVWAAVDSDFVDWGECGAAVVEWVPVVASDGWSVWPVGLCGGGPGEGDDCDD